MMFLVVEEGVYRHTLAGPFADLDEAIEFATNLAIVDGDGYHDYDIYELDPDDRGVLGGRDWGPHMKRPTQSELRNRRGTVGYTLGHVGGRRAPDAEVQWFPFPKTRYGK